jgi:hypothetical protein
LNNFVCICRPGYIWDVMTNACIEPCHFEDIECMNCSAIPFVASKKALHLNSPKVHIINLSGGASMASAYSTRSTDYSKLVNVKCECSLGYSWDFNRKRCFLNTL